ncbi:MAG: hypothetical protein DME18_12290, partial [Verrucomicrobia bacterium]
MKKIVRNDAERGGAGLTAQPLAAPAANAQAIRGSEFFRPPKPKGRCVLSGLSRTTILEHGEAGDFKLVRLRKRGSRRGIVLINFHSSSAIYSPAPREPVRAFTIVGATSKARKGVSLGRVLALSNPQKKVIHHTCGIIFGCCGTVFVKTSSIKTHSRIHEEISIRSHRHRYSGMNWSRSWDGQIPQANTDVSRLRPAPTVKYCIAKLL